MSALLLRWVVDPPAMTFRWIGPAGVLDAVAQRAPQAPVAGFVVPAAVLPEPDDILSFISSLDGALQ